MLLIRRLYVYLICGVSLTVLAIGFINLLELAMLQTWDSISGTRLIEGTGTDVRRDVSLFLALIVVALPIWVLHWYLAERWARLEGEQSDRGSGIRALYFAALLWVTLVVWGPAVESLVNSGISRVLGVAFFPGASDVINAVAVLVILIGIWAYHAWVRDYDTRIQQMSGMGVWTVRAYVYAAAFFAAIFLLVGVAQLMQLSVDAMVGQRGVIAGEDWWRAEIARSLSLILVGGLIWGAHWGYSLRLVYGVDWRAASEQGSLLRRAYLYLIVLAGVVVTLVSVSISLTEALRWAFGVDPGAAADPLWARLVEPLAFAVPFALFWLFHHRVIGQEASRFAEQPVRVSVERVYAYIVAFFALIFTAAGLAYLLAVLIEFAFESARILDTDPEWVPEQVGQFLSITLIGGVVWAWHWFGVQRRLSTDPEVERSATSRRVFIYLVLTASTLAVLVALAIVLYEVLQIILGVRTAAGIAADVGPLLGTLIVAGGLLAYHLLILRDDLRHTRTEQIEEPAAEPVAAPAPARDVLLTLSGPPEADLAAIAADLRAYLPEGYDLSVRADGEGQTLSKSSTDAGDDTGAGAPNEEAVTETTDANGPDEPDRQNRIFT
jgi:hypothetical protein